jgi:hypothetical protein
LLGTGRPYYHKPLVLVLEADPVLALQGHPIRPAEGPLEVQMKRREFLLAPIVGLAGLKKAEPQPGGFGLVDANGRFYIIKAEALEEVERFPMSTNLVQISGRIK